MSDNSEGSDSTAIDCDSSSTLSQGIVTLALCFAILFALAFMGMYCKCGDNDEEEEDFDDDEKQRETTELEKDQVLALLKEQGLIQNWCTVRSSSRSFQHRDSEVAKPRKNLPISHGAGAGSDDDTSTTSRTGSEPNDIVVMVDLESQTDHNDNIVDSIMDHDDDEEEQQLPCCSICLSPFHDDDLVACQPAQNDHHDDKNSISHDNLCNNNNNHHNACTHTFHVSCMASWLSAGHDDCPLCRCEFWSRPGSLETCSNKSSTPTLEV